jgi:hypothetical protein
MDKPKHTTGPWIVNRNWSRTAIRVECKRGPLADVYCCHGVSALAARKHNANLMAASPDLLAALVMCVEDYENGLIETDAWQMLHIGKVERAPTPCHIMEARAAIAKAMEG